MRKIVSVLALLLFLQVFCLPGRAEEGSWETLHQHALSLYQSGMFSEAVTEGLKALGEAEKTAGPDSPEAASTLGLLANAWHSLGQYDEAGPYYLRALAIHEARNGPNHPDTASTLNNLAQLRHFQARYAESEALYRRAIESSK
ncbi:MAG TPA: tetratricopeptide repeat protein, partial [Aminivibrio sp.]|nr:tetratricopeptide repeat protein [Aminivibrio sp.]